MHIGALQKRVAESANKKHVLCSMTLTPAPHTIRHSIQYGIALSKTWHDRYSSHFIPAIQSKGGIHGKLKSMQQLAHQVLANIQIPAWPPQSGPACKQLEEVASMATTEEPTNHAKWALKRYSWHSISHVVCLRISESTGADTPTVSDRVALSPVFHVHG